MLIFSSIINAQHLYTSKIIKVSDSIIIANTNERLSKYFNIDIGSYYKYTEKRKESTDKFLNRKKLSKYTTEIWVNYDFNFPGIEGVRWSFWVKLDNKLKPIEKLDLSFIPEFLWANDTCNFISKQNALKIAIRYFLKNGIEICEPILEYNETFKQYTYLIANKLTKFEEERERGKFFGTAENVRIDAITGRFLERFECSYGVIFID